MTVIMKKADNICPYCGAKISYREKAKIDHRCWKRCKICGNQFTISTKWSVLFLLPSFLVFLLVLFDVKIENVYSSFGGKGNVMKLEKQITNGELLELTKKAFENNEVAEFLCGEKGYACPISHFVPANVPTDFSRIIDFGVYKLYEETKNEKIVAKFEEAILYLLDCDPAKNWIAFMVCWNQIRNEKRHEAPFKFINQELIEKLKETLLKHEKELRVCKEWQGWNEENGLWQEITRINNIATKDYGVSIL